VKPTGTIEWLAFMIFLVGHLFFFVWVAVLRLRK
jgi:hypothetical protein